MKKLLLFLLSFSCVNAFSQTVTTYAGKVNDDPNNNYESGTADDMSDTYFSLPQGLCIDKNGKLYISERNKIRIVHNNKLYIRAGNLGGPTFSEGYKNATGTQSTFRNPGGMVSDSNGNIFVADIENHCIRRIAKFVNPSNGQAVTTFAGANPTSGIPGNGTSGSVNGTGTAARFNKPTDIAIDSDGYFYVTEFDGFTIRKISPSGVVTTLAGAAGVEGTTDASSGSSARFGGPWGIAIYDANSIVVTDPWNTNIRKINMISGATTTLAGPTTGADPQQVDGTLSEARFKAPKGIVVVNGIIYVGDQNTIRAIDVANNSVTTFAGDKSSFEVKDGEGDAAGFTEISDITTDGFGNLYVSENSGLVSSSVIRKVVINNLAPSADFSAPKRNLIVAEHIILSDISGGQAATSRTWEVDKTTYNIHGGSLTSKTLELSFSATGFYGISLTISNDYGSDSKTLDAYFSVSTTGSVSRYSASNLVKVYPNPSSSFAKIALDPSLKGPQTRVKLYDINSRLINDISGKSSINTSILPNGTYYITVVNDDVSFAKKLVVTH